MLRFQLVSLLLFLRASPIPLPPLHLILLNPKFPLVGVVFGFRVTPITLARSYCTLLLSKCNIVSVGLLLRD